MTDTPQSESSQSSPMPVVAIGASAGGLDQIKLLLSHLPTDTGAAFVVMQHLDPTHESQLPELLDRVCELPVVAIDEQMTAVADQVYVLAPGQRLDINSDHVLQASTGMAREATPTLIDHFFRSLAAALGRHAVGIVLSGIGSDGALGLKAIRSAGGLAIAQRPGNAEYDGMPRAAAKYASPDCLLDTADMVAPLCNHLRLTLRNYSPETANATSENNSNDEHNVTGNTDIDDQTLSLILELLRERGSYDFRHHKTSMLKRRLQRRMALNGVNNSQTYVRTLRQDESERARLCSDFLISVTDFFREPQSYDKLARTVIRTLLHGRSITAPIRVWVPGCATGEEAYTIAMLLAEAIELSGRDYKFIIFATDIDETALAHARAGIYPDSIEADVSGDRLGRFFDKVDSHYQIKRSIREQVVFAPQSVTDDPPYSHLDLVSCRNLLIYLNADTQKRLITLFHFALQDSGFLFLGSSETVGNQIDLFEPLSKEHHIYRRLANNRQYRVDFPTPHSVRNNLSALAITSHDSYATPPKDAEQIARDILLKEHVPASVLVNRKLEILCSYGPIQEFLSLPLGESSLALLNMVHEEYRSHLRAVTHRALRYKEQSDITTTLRNDDEQSLLITARPLQQPKHARGLVLVTFERVREVGLARLAGSSHSDLEQQLAEELDATRNELHGTIGALEESNEDLKGSNEEIMSMNEELQSTNEELETSKEELQSVNEELTTVNTELESKVAELERAHNDLSNLFAGTHVATLFLDQHMRIKRFTPAIRGLLSLITGDIGRPLRDMTLKFTDPELINDAHQVLAQLAPREAEVASDDGRWYQRRIQPYRTRDNVIDGVVITFVDISELKNTMLRAHEHEVQLDLAVSALSGGMWEMQIDPNAPHELPEAIYLSPRLKQLLGFADEQLPNTLQAWIERIDRNDQQCFSEAVRRHSNKDQPVYYRIRHRNGSLRWFASYGTLHRDAYGHETRWIGIDCDVTQYKQAQLHTQHMQRQLQLLADGVPQLIAFIDCQQVIRFANTALADWLERSTEQLVGHNIADVLAAEVMATLAPNINTALQGKASSCELNMPHNTAGERRSQVSLLPHVVDGDTLGLYVVMTDTTGHQSMLDSEEEALRLTYIHRMATIGEMASTLAHDLNQPLSAINSYAGALTHMLHAGKPAQETTPILTKMANQVERAHHIIGDVRSFVGRRDDGYEAVDLNELLRKAVALTSGRARKMRVETQMSEYTTLPTTNGNAVQLQQVLINLINNAIDAMEHTADDQRWLRLHTEVPDTDHVHVVISDSGPGIAPSRLDSIFNSFQSTKLDGMGMGLAISRAIVRWHGGQLWAESQDGHGATFYLSLPVGD